MRRNIFLPLIAVLTFLSGSPVYAYNDVTVEGIVYRISSSDADKTVTAVGVEDKNAAEIHIKASVETGGVSLPVTRIGNRAFAGCAAKSVTLPATIVSIGQEAFMDSRLEKIEIPNSVRNIGDRAFANCKLSEIRLPEFTILDIGNSREIAEIGKTICGSYTGYGKIIKGVGIDDYYINGMTLAIATKPTDEGLKFSLTIANGKNASSQDKKFFNALLEALTLPGGEIMMNDPEIKKTTENGATSYVISYRKENYPHAQDFNLSSDGKTAQLFIDDLTISSPHNPENGGTNYSFYLTTGRDGEVEPPVSKSDVTIDGITYRREKSGISVVRIDDTDAVIPATVMHEGESCPVTRIDLTSNNAPYLSTLTLEKNPLLTRINIPAIDELDIQESPTEWCQKNFYYFWDNSEDPYYPEKIFRPSNGISKAATVKFNGKRITDLTLEADAKRIGDASFAGMKQLKSVTILGEPLMGEYPFKGNQMKVEKVDAPNIAYALRQRVFGQFDNADFSLCISGEQLTALVIPDKIGTLQSNTVVNNRIEYLYIPATSDVFLKHEALVLRGLKGAYIDKAEPPMDGFSLRETGDYYAFDLKHPGLWPRLKGFSYFVPTAVYSDYQNNPQNPWHSVTEFHNEQFKLDYDYQVTGFDFASEKLPF